MEKAGFLLSQAPSISLERINAQIEQMVRERAESIAAAQRAEGVLLVLQAWKSDLECQALNRKAALDARELMGNGVK